MSRRLVILHGYTASPTSHWFPWLREHFSASGVDVSVPALPHSEAPELEPWVEAAVSAFGEVDEDLVVVGHSLGCITALHALAQLTGEWKLGGLIMVSGFDAPLSTLPELDAFTANVPDLGAIAERTAHRRVIASDNDDIVAPVASAELARHLRASLDTIPGAGHFLDREGHLTLPLAAERIDAAFAAR